MPPAARTWLGWHMSCCAVASGSSSTASVDCAAASDRLLEQYICVVPAVLAALVATLAIMLCARVAPLARVRSGEDTHENMQGL